MTEHEPLQPVPDLQLAQLAEAASRYEAAMTEEAARYLLDRGLTVETATTARLGVVDDPLPAHERYRGWLAIPYLLKGQVIQIRFRCIKQHDHREFSHGKYGQPSGERLRIYNLDALHNAEDELHVTEGEFDAMILNQCGLPAIAFPGASSFQRHHGRMLAGFNRIYVWGDPDEAGAEFTTKITNRLPSSARGVQLRGGDVTDVYLAGGAKAIHSLIKQ